MNITKILLTSSLLTVSLVAVSFAKGPGSNNGNNQGQGQFGANAALRCDGSGLQGNRTACDASANCKGTGIPLQDGSGKITNNMGNPNSTGTPLKDGSGKGSAPGKGPKNGTGNKGNCPNPTPKA